jgi:hypothetical protein
MECKIIIHLIKVVGVGWTAWRCIHNSMEAFGGSFGSTCLLPSPLVQPLTVSLTGVAIGLS